MPAKSMVARPAARRDIDEAITYLLGEAGEDVAMTFIDALQSAYDLIAAFPESGSSRHAHDLALPGLRSRTITGYPYMIFYVERRDHVDVWRVLHAQRDIPRHLADPD